MNSIKDIYIDEQKKNPQNLVLMIECLLGDFSLKKNIFPNSTLYFSNDKYHQLIITGEVNSDNYTRISYETILILSACFPDFDGTEAEFEDYLNSNFEYDDMDPTTSVYLYVDINGDLYKYFSRETASKMVDSVINNVYNLNIKLYLKENQPKSNRILRYFSDGSYKKEIQRKFIIASTID